MRANKEKTNVVTESVVKDNEDQLGTVEGKVRAVAKTIGGELHL